MPRITYKPEGVEEARVWDFDFGKIMSPERILIEKAAGGCGWDACQHLFFQNSTAVVGAVMFVMMKREVPTLRREEFVFCDDDFEVDLTDIEARATLAAMDLAEDLDESARAARDELRARFADEDTEVDAEGDSDPKAT